MKQPTIRDVLDAINKINIEMKETNENVQFLAHEVDTRFTKVENEIGDLKKTTTRIEATMVSKSYLDDNFVRKQKPSLLGF